MAQNTSPIFPLVPVITFAVPSATGNTSVGDIITTTPAVVVATGNATNGSRVDYLRIRPLGTNIATVLRIFINNGSTAATATNNTLFTEVTMAATTVSQTSALAETTVPLDLALPPSYRIYVLNATTVAAGFHVTAVSGDY